MSVADPQGILLIGTTAQLTDKAQKETFHRFRRNLWNPTVLTFDELLARAKFQLTRLGPITTDPPDSAPLQAAGALSGAFCVPAVRPTSDRWDESDKLEVSGLDLPPESDEEWEPDPDLYRDE